MDSVVEDLEALSSRQPVEESLQSPHDDESTKVDDLCTPTVVRIEYEQEGTMLPAQSCDGFELVNFENEIGIIAFSG